MAILIEFGVVLCTLFGINYLTFRHIRGLNRAWYVKGVYLIISVVVLPLLLLQTLNSLSGDYIGVKMDLRLCRIAGGCGGEKSRPPTADRPATDLMAADIYQVCKLGLNERHDGWSDEFEFHPYVVEAGRRRKSIDDCRRVLGLPTIAEEEENDRKLAEETRIRNLDQGGLCREAVDEVSAYWNLSDAAKGAVGEALRRQYSTEACLLALGRSGPAMGASPQVQSPGLAIGAPDFPTGYIQNAKSNFANLRENPGKFSRILRPLANGTEVVLLGMKPSPSSGHAYCRVLTRDGVAGYVDYELVNGNCFLDSTQTSYLMEVERQEKMEAFRLFRDIAVIGLGLALTRK